MTEALDALQPADRRLVERIASDAGVSTAALIPEIISAYLRLAKDLPAVLPRDPMRGLSIAASRREKGK